MLKIKKTILLALFSLATVPTYAAVAKPSTVYTERELAVLAIAQEYVNNRRETAAEKLAGAQDAFKENPTLAARDHRDFLEKKYKSELLKQKIFEASIRINGSLCCRLFNKIASCCCSRRR